MSIYTSLCCISLCVCFCAANGGVCLQYSACAAPLNDCLQEILCCYWTCPWDCAIPGGGGGVHLFRFVFKRVCLFRLFRLFRNIETNQKICFLVSWNKPKPIPPAYVAWRNRFTLCPYHLDSLKSFSVSCDISFLNYFNLSKIFIYAAENLLKPRQNY